MVLQFMLHLIFEEDKLKTTPVAVKGLIDLRQTETDRAKTKDRETEKQRSVYGSLTSGMKRCVDSNGHVTGRYNDIHHEK